MQSNRIKRVMWPAISIFLLSTGYILCRYLFFDLYGMKELPLILFVFGLIVICIAALFNSKKIMVCSSWGYSISFFMGILFQTDWIDSKGTAMNSLWIWFALGMLTFVLIGVVWEAISKAIKKSRIRHIELGTTSETYLDVENRKTP